MTGFTTDGEYLRQGAEMLLEAATGFEEDAGQFEDDTYLPTTAFHNVPVPSHVNFSQRLADMIEGPYEDIRVAVAETMARTVEVVRDNAAALADAGHHYERQDQEAMLWFQRWVE